ncbi:MAG: abortive phage infection protein [Christensenellales bacterium]
MRNYTKLLELAKQNNGYVFTKDLSQNKIAKDYLKFAVEDGILEKVARGIYIESDKFVDLLFVYQMNYSKVVFSSFTSAYLWNLTTRDTEIIYGATPLNYFAKSSHNNTVLVRENDDIYNLGITTIKTIFGNIVKCHDIHRTICDLFSDKYVGDKFVQVEALKNYLKLPNKDTVKLMKYAKVLGVDKQLREKLEVLL